MTTLANSAGYFGNADGTGGAFGTATFSYPYGIAVVSPDLAYFSDQLNNCIRILRQ